MACHRLAGEHAIFFLRSEVNRPPLGEKKSANRG